MTLALYGKSRRRQQALIFAAFLAIVAGALAAASTLRTPARAIEEDTCIERANFVLVVDLSTSITQGELNTMKAGIDAFLKTPVIQNSGSAFRIVPFGTGAGNADYPATGWVTNAEAINAAAALAFPGGARYTNTDRGIEVAMLKNGSSSDPHIMLVITDGSPNMKSSDVGTPSLPGTLADPWNAARTAAINRATAARAAGFTVHAIYVTADDNNLGTALSNASDPRTVGQYSEEVMKGIAGIDPASAPAGSFISGAADFSSVGTDLLTSLGCTRTVDVVKVASGSHPGEKFAGIIDDGGQDANKLWEQTLAENVTVSATPDSNQLSRDAHTVTETLPLADGWTLVGYSVNEAPYTCTGQETYGPTANIPADSKDYVVCVKNAYESAPEPGVSVTKVPVNGNSVTDPDDVAWTITVSNTAPAGPAAEVYVYDGDVTVLEGPTGANGASCVGALETGPNGATCTLPPTGSVTWKVAPNPAPTRQQCQDDPYTNNVAWSFPASDAQNVSGGTIVLEGDEAECEPDERTVTVCKTWESNEDGVLEGVFDWTFDVRPEGHSTIEVTVPVSEAQDGGDQCESVQVRADVAFDVVEWQPALGRPAGWAGDAVGYPQYSINGGTRISNTTTSKIAAGTSAVEVRFFNKEGRITISKGNGFLQDGFVRWQATFVNTGPQITVDFSDTYEPNGTGTTMYQVVVSDYSGVYQCLFTPDGTGYWCDSLVIPAGGTVSLTVDTHRPRAKCEDQTVYNNLSVTIGGQHVPGSPDNGNFYTEPGDPDLCSVVIQVCKLWQSDGPQSGTLPFSFDVSDSTEEVNITLAGVTEGSEAVCQFLSVAPGDIEVTELVPPGFLTPEWEVYGVEDNLLDSGSGATAEFNTFNCQPRPQDQSQLLGLIKELASLIIELDPPQEPFCTVFFYNMDDGVTLNDAALRVEKYLDINGDGDANDPGEGLINDWDFTVSGPEVNEIVATGSGPHPFGMLFYPGLSTGGVYTVSETLPAGWNVTRAEVGATNYGATTSVSATIPAEGAVVVRFYNQPLGSIHVHKVAYTRHNLGPDVFAPNDDDGWKIRVSSAACGNLVFEKFTDANGDVIFHNLPLCTDYVVAEVGPNAASPGFVQVAPAGPYTNVTPGGGQTLTFVNRKDTSDPPCTNCTPVTVTTTPTTPTATPTTPTTPTEPTVTEEPSEEPTTPVTQIAGEQTPGPGSTPIAPDTGNGFMGGASGGLNLLLMLAGMVTISLGLGTLALGRRK